MNTRTVQALIDEAFERGNYHPVIDRPAGGLISYSMTVYLDTTPDISSLLAAELTGTCDWEVTFDDGLTFQAYVARVEWGNLRSLIEFVATGAPIDGATNPQETL